MTDTTKVSTERRAIRRFEPFSSLVKIDVSAVTHAGLIRPNNEDQFLVTKLTRTLETLATTVPADDAPAIAEEVNYVLAVADGMGGHAAGEVASRLVLSAAVSLALELPDWSFKVNEGMLPTIERRARQLVQQVGSILIERGREDPALRGMGSTLTAVRSYGRDLLVVHVGDSRAYVVRAGRIHRLTKDHTYAQMLVDGGLLPAESVPDSRVRHVLVNALGGSTESVNVDVDLLQLEDHDRLLLCSDGLTDHVADDSIANVLASSPSSHEACQTLLDMALKGGGRDNITIIVAAYDLP